MAFIPGGKLWLSMIFPGMRVDTIFQRTLVLVDSMMLFTCDTRMHGRWFSTLKNLETAFSGKAKGRKSNTGHEHTSAGEDVRYRRCQIGGISPSLWASSTTPRHSRRDTADASLGRSALSSSSRTHRPYLCLCFPKRIKRHWRASPPSRSRSCCHLGPPSSLFDIPTDRTGAGVLKLYWARG